MGEGKRLRSHHPKRKRVKKDETPDYDDDDDDVNYSYEEYLSEADDDY